MLIERREAKRKRRIGDRLFQAIFMAMGEGAVSWNSAGNIVAINPAAENLLGLSAAALMGRSAADFARALNFVREDETPFPCELDPTTLALQTGHAQCNVLIGAHRPDATLVWMSFNAQPLFADGESRPYGVVTTFRDVTERKRAEDALSFVARRGWLTSNEKFFDALAKYLGKALSVDHVLVSTLTEDRSVAETVALYAKGAIVANLRYRLEGTPCEQVMGQRFCFFRSGIQQMFPEDALLAEMRAESYSGLPLWDSAGQPIGLIAVMDGKPLRDEAVVSQVLQFMAPRAAAELERERNDRILRQSEREFRTLAENLPDPMVRYDRMGRRTYISPVLERAFAVTAESMVGVNVRETDPTAMPMRETYVRALEHTLATGERTEFELQMAPPGGTMHTYLCFMVAERAEDGRISGAIAVSRDITEHKATEARLAVQARRAEVLLELPDASEAMDEVAFMQRGQELAEELTGSSICFIHFVNEDEDSIDLVTWSRRTLEHYCRASFNKHYPASQAGIWADALRRRRPVVFNDYAAYPHKHGLPEGHAELTRLISLPVIENGKVVMLAGVGNKPADYTELDVETVQLIANEIWRIVQRKRTDKQLKEHRCHLERLVESRTQALSAAKEAAELANRGKSHFLAAASHDLRQPLQAIRLFNDALAMSGLNERQKKISNALSKSVSSLNELLNDLLDLSRFDAGNIEPQPVPILAEDVLKTIRLGFDAVCQEKNLQLRLACPRHKLVLFSDENLLLTLLRNLVSNAVKYTQHCGVLLSIRRRRDRALIQVWDTGIGIPAAQRDAIFEEYFQIGNPQRDRTKGVGLGLAIVRRLSKLLGVTVCLYSREGKGSVFEVSVPLAESSMSAVVPQISADPQDTAASRLAGKRIVVIEDDRTAADAIQLALETEGAEVFVFDEPEEALRSVEALEADHYLSDYRLPGMNGVQLLDAIQMKSAVPIKAVLLTGNVSPDQIAALRSSHWRVILKPVALAELLSALEGQETLDLA